MHLGAEGSLFANMSFPAKTCIMEEGKANESVVCGVGVMLSAQLGMGG